MSKLATILAVLVVLPTAVLSLLAGRVLQNWEMVLHSRFEAVATRAIREVSARLWNDMESDWHTVRGGVSDALAPRGRLRDLDAAVTDIKRAAPLADEILIFMDPLGFVYPETEGHDRSDLAQALRQELVAGNSLRGIGISTLLLRHAGDLYCFGTLRQGPGLYVGYRVRPGVFQRRLQEALTDVSGDDLSLTVALPDGERFPVLVSDPFAPSPDPIAGDRPGGRGGLAIDLFTTALASPLDFLTATAAWRDPGQMARAAAWQSRLYGWGLALMVLCIALGVGLILRQTAVEIRHLREHNDLVMSMSHDLRTPIAAMKMMAESLYLGHVSGREQRREFLRTLITETDRLSDMAERVLFLVRQERRAVVRTMERLDAGELVSTVVDIYRERAALNMPAAAPQRIQRFVGDDLPPVWGDRRALQAVLANLIDNALTHGAPSGAPCVAVRVCADAAVRRGRLCLRLAVRDFGPGIAGREKTKVFRRYHRGAGVKTAGSGLGLALCRDIVRAHGGWMEVWSEPGRGSEFRVFLRARKESA